MPFIEIFRKCNFLVLGWGEEDSIVKQNKTHHSAFMFTSMPIPTFALTELWGSCVRRLVIEEAVTMKGISSEPIAFSLDPHSQENSIQQVHFTPRNLGLHTFLYCCFRIQPHFVSNRELYLQVNCKLRFPTTTLPVPHVES